jgi:hypothetical protein
MPQINGHDHIFPRLLISMSQLILKSRQPEPSTILAETPVKEREKIYTELMSRKDVCAMDVMGLSWIFVEEDDY